MKTKRNSEGGFIPVVFLVIGMYVSAVFAAGLTDAAHDKNKHHEVREARVPEGMVCFADPNYVDYGEVVNRGNR